MSERIYVSVWVDRIVSVSDDPEHFKAQVESLAPADAQSLMEVCVRKRPNGEYGCFIGERQIGKSYRSFRRARGYARSWVGENLILPRIRRSWSSAIAIAILAFCAGVLISASPRNDAGQARAADGAVAQATGVIALSADEQRDLQRAAALLGFPLGTSQESSTAIVVADPLCPVCRAFEQSLEQLPSERKPVIIPVGIRGDRSFALVASFYEATRGAPKARAALWKELLLMSDAEADAFVTKNPPSGDSTKLAEMSLTLFHMLGFKKTPTLVAADGALNGALEFPELARWLAAHSVVGR